jgi:hypothetical protein
MRKMSLPLPNMREWGALPAPIGGGVAMNLPYCKQTPVEL